MPIRKESRKEGESATDFSKRRNFERKESKSAPITRSDHVPILYHERTVSNIANKPFICSDGTVKILNHPSGKVEISGEASKIEEYKRRVILHYRTLQSAKDSGYEFFDDKILQPKYKTSNITTKHVEIVFGELKKLGEIVNINEINKNNIGINPVTGKPELLDHSIPVIVKHKSEKNNSGNQPVEDADPNSTLSLEDLQKKRERLLNDIEEEKAQGFIHQNRNKMKDAKKAIDTIDEAIKAEEKAKEAEGWTLKATFEIEFPEVNLTEQDWQNITQDFDKVKNEFIKKLIKNYLPIQLCLSVIAKLRRDDPQNLLTKYTQIAKEFYANSESEALKAALAQPSIPIVFRSLLNKDFKLAIASLPKIRYKILNDFMVMFESAGQNDFELSNPTKKILNCYLDRFSTEGTKFYQMIKKNGS